jgi:hypothetical protein
MISEPTAAIPQQTDATTPASQGDQTVQNSQVANQNGDNDNNANQFLPYLLIATAAVVIIVLAGSLIYRRKAADAKR